MPPISHHRNEPLVNDDKFPCAKHRAGGKSVNLHVIGVGFYKEPDHKTGVAS